MKKKSLLILILVAVLAFILVACAGTNKGGTAGATTETTAGTSVTASETGVKTGIKIGISLPTLREERWTIDKEAFEAAAAEMGIEIFTEIADANAGRQQSQCENLLTKGIDILIIAPHDGDAAAQIVEMCQAENVPVITYDRPIQNAKVDLYVTFDQYEIGRLMGQYVVDNVANGNIVFMRGDPQDATCIPLAQGALDAIQAKVDSGDYIIVADQSCIDWEPSEGLKHVEQALTANNNNVAAVIAPNDGTAGGAIQALAAQGLAGKVIVTGQDGEEDAIERIKEGTQSMTVDFDCNEMARAAFAQAVKMANNEAPDTNGVDFNGLIDVPTLGFPPFAVTHENYASLGY
jgi:D-xylose transport system substrate-binding protein